MSTTDLNTDPNVIGTTVSVGGVDYIVGPYPSSYNVLWTQSNTSTLPGFRLLPAIAGGADEDSGDGDATSGDNDDSTSGDNDDSSTDAPAKSFTQDQVNALIAKEVAKATRGKVDPKALQFGSAKELEEFLASTREAADAAKDEATKAQEQAVKEAVEAANSSILATANERVVKAEFLMAAMQHDIEVSAREDAFLLAKSMEIWEGVSIDDKGVVTGFDDDFFETLKEQKSYLFKGSDDGSSNDIGGGASGKTGKDRDAELVGKYPALRGTGRI